jgi:hypothetical protein
MLVSVTLAGCSQTFGKGGSRDRALDKNRKTLLDTSRTGPIHEKFCEGGRQNTELCRRALENPEEAAAFMAEEEE